MMHPFFRQISKDMGEIRQLEDRFGLNPTARARLAVTVGLQSDQVNEEHRGDVDFQIVDTSEVSDTGT